MIRGTVEIEIRRSLAVTKMLLHACGGEVKSRQRGDLRRCKGLVPEPASPTLASSTFFAAAPPRQPQAPVAGGTRGRAASFPLICGSDRDLHNCIQRLLWTPHFNTPALCEGVL
ncbi:hypothetical protein VTI28DRAFT_3228 [Corynascus sepedonium]